MQVSMAIIGSIPRAPHGLVSGGGSESSGTTGPEPEPDVPGFTVISRVALVRIVAAPVVTVVTVTVIGMTRFEDVVLM